MSVASWHGVCSVMQHGFSLMCSAISCFIWLLIALHNDAANMLMRANLLPRRGVWHSKLSSDTNSPSIIGFKSNRKRTFLNYEKWFKNKLISARFLKHPIFLFFSAPLKNTRNVEPWQKQPWEQRRSHVKGVPHDQSLFIATWPSFHRINMRG